MKNKTLKHRKLLIFIAILLVLGTCGITFGRYIYDSVENFYFSSKKFYFNSDKLSARMASYQLENWSGVDNYTIIINLNSIKNNLVSADSDIAYNITYSCSDTVICQSTKDNGIISSSTNTDSFNVVVTPTSSFNDGDRVIVSILVTSTSPYEKTLSGRFVLRVGKIGLSYEITDSVNSPYLEMRITNTIDYYTVKTAFTFNGESYSVGDRIDINTYLTLGTYQNNCASTTITLTFDPNIVLLDMTNPSYLIKQSETTTQINGFDYINSYSFRMDAISSETVKFYKTNTTNNYTYPFTNATSIIGFSYN